MYNDKIIISTGALQGSTGTNVVNNNAQVPFKIVKIKYYSATATLILN